MANLIFETEKKILAQESFSSLKRNMDRMKTALEEAGIIMLNPLGEDYSETRTDVEATILETATTSLKISEVIKPVLYISQEEKRVLLQKGIVIIA